MKVIGVIPARLGSTRLSEKVLENINGKPMIQHVWERANDASALSEAIVACDDQKIVDCVESFGGNAMLTSKDHPNGSSRIAEVAQKTDADVYINIQGDEPMMHSDSINRLVQLFSDSSVEVATLAVERTDKEDFENPNVVKVVCDEKKDALYFSRSPLPYDREGTDENISYLKHLGIYGYRRDFLLQFVTWEMGELESKEKLEQLRILERGKKIRVAITPHDSFSVDTASDLQLVEAKLKNSTRKSGVS